ncbi:hypothetical protein BN946_scf184535.g1 [Trametes cinnabarina]|uniref:Ubiquitin-like protease family profile domain-containing protein n=1 Tax=Pycnoporus cinnabarinus TaxID=5643 RepID=A0A060SZC2_PYCCI|nr:hypothetical protein BN946_scf184535.g1 [Trametes cinnabarina]
MLTALHKRSGQAWFDGALSIRDPRFHQGTERFPLRALGLWRELAALVELQKDWEISLSWLTTAIVKAETPESMVLLKEARKHLLGLPWNGPLHIGTCFSTTSELSRLLGRKWLSDSLIDLMVESLTHSMHPKSNVLIGNLTVMYEACRGERTKDFSKKNTPLLHRIKASVDSQECTQAYFPICMNNNHWIVFHVDFQIEIIEYGMSIIT